MGIALAFVSALSYAGMAVLVRKATQRGGADPGILVALLVNVLLHGSVVATRSLSGVSIDWRAAGLAWFVVAGILTTLIGRASLYGGIRRIGPSRAMSLKNLAPFFSVAGAFIVLGQRVPALAAVGVAVALASYLLFMREGYRRAHALPVATAVGSSSRAHLVTQPLTDRRPTWLTTGHLLCVAAAVCYGFGTVVRRLGLDVLPDPYVGALVASTAGAVTYVAYLAVRGQAGSTIAIAWSEMNVFFLYAGVLSTVGQLALFVALGSTPVAYVSVVAASDTLLTLVIASVFLRSAERLDRWVWLSALGVFAGSVLIVLA